MKGLFPISIFTIIVLFSIYQNSRIWDKVSDVNQFTHQVIIETKKLIKQLKIDQKELIQPLEKQFSDIIQNQKYAANQLEGLDKEVIESYSNYFQREDPEGKPSKKQGIGATGVSQGKSDMTK